MKIIFMIVFYIFTQNASAQKTYKDNPYISEENRKIPGLVEQNLPSSQVEFREKTVLAISKDIANAAKYSLLTYSDDQDYIEKNGWKKISIERKKRLFESQKTVLLIRVNEQEKVVEIAIRGTSNLDDALVDLDAASTFDQKLGFRIHSGFAFLAAEIIEAIKNEYLTETILKNYSFKLYGHSLGGAVAAIVSMHLHQDGAMIKNVITFGAPRFTTNEGSRKYQLLNQVTYRVVRCDDVIPFLPPPNFFGWSKENYQANGNILLLLTPPYFDYSIGIDIERDFINQLRLELKNLSNRDLLAFGHRMNNYQDLLEWFDPRGLQIQTLHERKGTRLVQLDMIKLRPISYTLREKDKLCPAKLKY